MSDRTPEQVVTELYGATLTAPREFCTELLKRLRAEGMLVEEGEVKVRLAGDELEERIAEAMATAAKQHEFGRLFDPAVWEGSAQWWAAIAARVVRGETQEIDRG